MSSYVAEIWIVHVACTLINIIVDTRPDIPKGIILTQAQVCQIVESVDNLLTMGLGTHEWAVLEDKLHREEKK